MPPAVRRFRELTGSHRQRCRMVARYALPPLAVIAGRSAAVWHGAGLVGQDDPVEVLTPWSDRFGPVRGLTIHVSDLADGDRWQVDGVPVTSPLRTCWDLATWLSAPDAVAQVDRMLARGLITQPSLSSYLAERTGQRGWRKLQRVLALADAAAASPWESRLRVRLVRAGLPRPASSYMIPDGARVDLAWPRHRVGVDLSDRSVTGVKSGLRVGPPGWTILYATPEGICRDLVGFVAQVRSALRHRGPPRDTTPHPHYRVDHGETNAIGDQVASVTP